jgi:hypothetical protein
VTNVKVYERSFTACHGEQLGWVVNCMSGSIVYAAGFAACFNGCTVASLRGSQSCETSGSHSNPGMRSDLRACYNRLYSTGPSAGNASKAVEVDKVCNDGIPLPAACSTEAWHVNAYSTGNITGPFQGEGFA